MSETVAALVGVVIGGIIAIAKDITLKHLSKKDEAEYLAIRVICKLDTFVEGCANISSDTGRADKNGHNEPQEKEPDFELDSLDVDWKSLPSNLMYEILNFPNEIISADKAIADCYDLVATPPDYCEFFEERQLQYSELGLKAHSIASQLRKKYVLPKPDFSKWNPIEHIDEWKQRLLKSRDDRHKRHEEWVEKMNRNQRNYIEELRK